MDGFERETETTTGRKKTDQSYEFTKDRDRARDTRMAQRFTYKNPRLDPLVHNRQVQLEGIE